MNYPDHRLLRAPIVLFVLLGAAFGALTSASAQSGTANESGAAKDPGTAKQSGAAKDFVIDDWSHHHLIFSNPAELPDEVREKIVKDPRYQMQQRRRSMGQRPVVVAPGFVSPDMSTDSSATSASISVAAEKKEKLKKDWSVSLGGVAATLTGVVGALSSGISGSSKLTVDSVVLSASAPTPATSTGTFSGLPTGATAPTITVNGGGQTITLTTNATAKTATGTITAGSPGAPLTGQTIVIPSNAGSIALTPGGSPATMTGSVTTAFTSGTVTLTYNNGGGTANTLSLTPSLETQGNVVGTFTATGTSTGQFTPGTTAGTFKVTSGLNTATLTPNGYQYFTITSSIAAGNEAMVGSTTYTFEASVGSTANQVLIGSNTDVTAAQNLAAAIMGDSSMCSVSPCFGTGTTKVSNISASYDASGHTYVFNSTGSSFTISDNSSHVSESSGTVTAGSNSCSGSGSTIAGGFGAVATASGGGSSSAANMAAALNLCTNLGMTATSTALTVTATNTAYGSTPAVSNAETLGGFSAAATQGSNGTSGCSNSTTGQFPTYSAITTAIEASNISAAISSCKSSYAPVGATASYTSGSTFTVTAVSPGSAVTLSGTSPSGFSWTPTPGNDTGAGTCTSGTAGTFVNSGVANTLAGNIYTVLTSSNCTASPGNSGVTAAYSGSNTFTVTANVLGSSPTFATTGSTATLISWGSVTGGSAGATTCTGTGPWTATFMTGTTTTATAANVTSAITACSGASTTVNATGNAVVSTAALGSGASLMVGASNNTNIFSWSAVTAGTDGTNSSTTFAYWSVNTYLTSAQVATNIATAVNANPTLQLSTGVTAADNSPASGDVTFTANEVGTSGNNSIAVTPSAFSAWTPSSTTDLTGGTSPTGGQVQPNAYPAKFSFDTSAADCTNDFVVYPTGVAGASATNVSTIVAYNSIYSGCSGNVPSLYWSYNTGTGDAVTTSPIISFDNTGSQIAFIQSTGTAASLVLLKWAPNTSGTLMNQTSGVNYQNCTAPCMYSIPFGNGKNDTLSSPFYDYHGDALYVGDDSGNLHQFTGVFNGAPAENITSPWPVNLGTNKLASPVYDGTWDAVFVGDLVGGLHCVTSTTGSCQGGQTTLGGGWYTSSATPVSGGQIADAPLINSSANYLLVFVNTSTSNTVYGYSEQFFANSPGSVSVGAGATGYYLYAGAYDNLYYQSSNNTGNMYVVGNTGVTTGATLYQVALSGGFLAGSTALVPGLTASATNAFPWPSPVTEFCNPGSNSACAIQSASASGCTVKTTSKTLTCTTGNFTSSDVGMSITGTDIAAGATVTGFTSSTTITMSADGTAGTTTGTATIGQTTAGTDYVFFSVNRGTGCASSSAGTGCILSYNVSNPASVSISGSGLNVTTPLTKGCWATGGTIIDNAVQSVTRAGASEIYFVNLNGNNVGGTGAPGNCTASNSQSITGVQTSQANPN